MPRSNMDVSRSPSIIPPSKALQAVTLAAAISGCTDDVHDQATMRILGVEASAPHAKVSGASTSGVHELCPNMNADGTMFYTTTTDFESFTPMYLAADGTSAEVNVDGVSGNNLACFRSNSDGTATAFSPDTEEIYLITPGTDWVSGGGSVALLYDDGYGINGLPAVDENTNSVVAYPNYVSTSKCTDIVDMSGNNVVSNEVISDSPCEYDPEYEPTSASWVFSVAPSVSDLNTGDTYLQDSDGAVSLLVEGMRTPHIYGATLYGAELNGDGDLDIVEYPLETEEIVDTAEAGETGSADSGDTAEPESEEECIPVANFVEGSDALTDGSTVCTEGGAAVDVNGSVLNETGSSTFVLDSAGDKVTVKKDPLLEVVADSSSYNGNSFKSSGADENGLTTWSLTLGVAGATDSVDVLEVTAGEVIGTCNGVETPYGVDKHLIASCLATDTGGTGGADDTGDTGNGGNSDESGDSQDSSVIDSAQPETGDSEVAEPDTDDQEAPNGQTVRPENPDGCGGCDTEGGDATTVGFAAFLALGALTARRRNDDEPPAQPVRVRVQ